MTVIFWSSVALLCLLVLGILLPPLWRARATDSETRAANARNIAIARQRRDELHAALQAGQLSDAEHAAQLAELEQALASDLRQTAESSTVRDGRWLAPMLAASLPLLALALYAGLGDYTRAVALRGGDGGDQVGSQAPPEITRMVEQLAARLRREPDDAEGWVMLGRSYKYLEQPQRAAEAFAYAYRLLGDQPSLLLEYADALALTQQGRLEGLAGELVFKALALAPDDKVALWLAGLAKAESGDAAGALAHWRRLDALLPSDSPYRAELRRMIGVVAPPLLAELPALTTETDIAATLAVAVSVSPNFRARVAPDDVVLVYAQAQTGSPMPLAIVKKRAADLPLRVTLSDAEALLPQHKLSDAASLRITARISRTGQATPQAGDLFGVREHVTPATHETITLVIDQEVAP